MIYNWQQPDWTDFKYNISEVMTIIYDFIALAGKVSGVFDCLTKQDKDKITIDFLVNEAIKTSEIEGEYLHRESVTNAVRRNLGFTVDNLLIVDPSAEGMANMLVHVREKFTEPLSENMLFDWHKEMMRGNKENMTIGNWRTHKELMQIISGPVGREKVHFEAPSSKDVPVEMNRFIEWFNKSEKTITTPLVRSGISHLYFESIHPFQDGNGRIGRAISDKAISQDLGYPVLFNLSKTIERKRDEYYNNLNISSKTNDISQWLKYFIKAVYQSQVEAQQEIEFVLKKTQFFDKWQKKLNHRQIKVIKRMFQEGPEGFEGGMSAKKYMRITKTSNATATRDLQDLKRKGIFQSIGGGRNTRYSLLQNQ
ncbi:MAG: Fic family protein [Flavobacteriaceae bacterium]|nr:Fic family protein [Flavobacteriaceae bacterium]MCY4217464.1 Fic family protein [Flavobacteriaceae bacterium]